MTVRSIARQISSLVQAVLLLIAKRIAYELFRSCFRPIQVTRTQGRTSDAYLTDVTDWNQRPVFAKQVNLGTAYRFTHGYRFRLRVIIGRNRIRGDKACRFRWPYM